MRWLPIALALAALLAAASPQSQSDSDRPPAPPGFVWNNALNYKGRGSGESVLNQRTPERLGDVRADVDLGAKIVVAFTPVQARGTHGKPRPVLFTGSVLNRDDARIRADVVTADGRLHGTMTLSVDDKHNITGITLNATDGQDRLVLTWNHR